jgi:flagellin
MAKSTDRQNESHGCDSCFLGMKMRVSTNVQSMRAQRYVSEHIETTAQEDMKLSAGDRIIRSADDPAGLAISEKMKSKIRSNYQAERNTNDSISLLQVAEGSLNVIQNMAIRLRELAMQSSNDTVSDMDRVIVDKEFQHLKAEVNRLTAGTTFNGHNIINEKSSVYDLQIGINGNSFEDRIKYDMSKVMDISNNFGIGSISLTSKSASQQSLSTIDQMMVKISSSRAELGSMGNRMNSVIQNLQVGRENMSASNSKIRDADIAQESSKRVISQMSETAAVSMLKMANDQPGLILKLINS